MKQQTTRQSMRRMIHSALVLVLTFAGISLGVPATQPANALTGTDGKTYKPLDVAGHKAAVLVFVLQDCPICNAYAPRVQRLASQFLPKGTAFYVIHVDPTLTADAARKHAEAYGYSIPILMDSKHELVSHMGILAVPTAVVLGDDGAVKYQGRIDDQYVAIGKARNVTTRYELRDAIVATLEGKPVKESRTRAVGCAVPDLPSGK